MGDFGNMFGEETKEEFEEGVSSLMNLFEQPDEPDTHAVAVSRTFSPSVPLRSPCGFTGLLNQGATCYLNSLLQALYMTPEFRQMIYGLTAQELGLDSDGAGDDESTEAVGGSDDAEEHMPAHWIESLNNLEAMGFGTMLATRALQKTSSGSTVSMERAIEWLFDPSNTAEPEPKQEASSKAKRPTKKSKVRKIPAELQKLFAYLELSQRRAVSTEQLTDSFGWKGRESYQQQDVHELNRLLFEAIEASLKRSSGENQISRLYEGTMVSKVRCLGCGNVTERNELFEDVTVLVKDRASLVESVTAMCEVELLEKDNQYHCEPCSTKQDAERWTCFAELPPVLIMSLLRFEYDYNTGERRKNCAAFEYPSCFDANANGWLSEPASAPVLYDLFGVIIHTGSAGTHGHYHAYLKDVMDAGNWVRTDMEEEEEQCSEGVSGVEQEGSCAAAEKTEQPKTSEAEDRFWQAIGDEEEGWFDFNDSRITPITGKQLREQFGGTRECAYMLIYRSRDLGRPEEPLTVPERLVAAVQADSVAIAKQAEEEENEFHRRRVVVYTPSMFYVDHAGVCRPMADSPPPLTMTVDSRLSVGHLLSTAVLMMAEEEADALSDSLALEVVSVSTNCLEAQAVFGPAEERMIDCGLRDNMELLLWNGKDINGHGWDKENRAIRVNVVWLTRDEETDDATIFLCEDSVPIQAKSISIDISNKATVADLCLRVSGIVQWPDSDMICQILQDDAVSALDGNQVLGSLALEPRTELMLEAGSVVADSSPTLAQERRQSGNTYRTVLVTDRITGLQPERTIRVHASREHSLLELKSIVLSFLGWDGNPEETRFRQLKDNGLGGRLFSSEARCLLDVGVHHGSHLALESGGAKDKTVSVAFCVEGSRDVQFHIDLVKGLTVEEAKYRMLEMVHLPMDRPYRLRKMDWWQGTEGDIIDNESRAVQNANLTTDVLLLEEGEVPRKGQISLTVRLFDYGDFDPREELLASACQLDIPLGQLSREEERDLPSFSAEESTPPAKEKAPEAGSEQLGLEAMADAAAACADEEEEEWPTHPEAWPLFSPALAHASTTPPRYSVTTLGCVVVDPEISLLEAKEHIIRQYPLLAGAVPMQLRLWCKNRILQDNDKSLKDHFVMNRGCLVVQVLNEAECYLHPRAGITLLYVFRRNTQLACFDRPREYLFNQKASSKPGRGLHACLARDLGIPAEHLELVKYVPFRDSWQRVEPRRVPVTPSGGEVGEAPTRHRWKKQSYKDGDVFAYKDLREPEDTFFSHASGLAPTKRPLLGQQRSSKSSKAKPRRRVEEAQLRIHVDVFEDGEEEGEEEKESDGLPGDGSADGLVPP